MLLSADAQEHTESIDWDSMTPNEQSKVINWIKWISEYDHNTERTGVSVLATVATDLGIDLDGEL